MNFTLVLILDITSALFLVLVVTIQSLFYVWLSGIYIKNFYICLYVVSVYLFQNGVSLHSFLLSKPLFTMFYSWYHYTKRVCQCGWRLEWLRNLIPMSIWDFCINFVKFLLVSNCLSTFELFYIIDILAGFNHVSMVLNFPTNGLVWSFLEISNQAIISFESLLHWYT